MSMRTRAIRALDTAIARKRGASSKKAASVMPKLEAAPETKSRVATATKVSSKSRKRKEVTGPVIVPFDSEKTSIDSKSRAISTTTAKKAKVDWLTQYEKIKVMRKTVKAAVDTMGCETFYENEDFDVKARRFHTFVACILSSQTKDEVTHAAVKRLIKLNGCTPASIRSMSTKELADTLKPVGFYNNKTRYLHKCCDIFEEKYNDDIPNTMKELVALPGIGPKMANLVMTVAWEQCEGICVDIHVHRITNRLKWVKTWTKQKNQGPEKTEEALEDFVPRELWKELNLVVVGFGQAICTPVLPNCDRCSLWDSCPSRRALWKPRDQRSASRSPVKKKRKVKIEVDES